LTPPRHLAKLTANAEKIPQNIREYRKTSETHGNRPQIERNTRKYAANSEKYAQIVRNMRKYAANTPQNP